MYRFALGSWGLLALAATALLASPPVPFSGKLAVDGTNFHGNALFAFSIVDQQGTEHWRHTDEDGATLENFVLNGRYLVLLGGHTGREAVEHYGAGHCLAYTTEEDQT